MKPSFTNRRVLELHNIVLILLLAGCSNFADEGEETKKPSKVPDQESWNSKAVFTNNGEISSEMTFGRMMKWNADQLTTFGDGVRVEFYEKGKHSATLVSDSGELRENTKLFTAWGRVYIISDSGVSLRTDKIYWDNAKERIFADNEVTLATNQDTLVGVRFEANKDLTNWKMRQATGRSARDIDLRRGEVKTTKPKREDEMNREMQKMLNEKK